ncbi:MAG: Na+/H+ antiporter NhaC family protein [Sulfurimonas sp.]|nr:Na+/H+ antiporter NhaC family protein [Sulfurimonas sp.]MDD5202102.1 Na+/H+ antiporter NhaC family protein [Sulfurimonas sp.]
MFGVLILNDFSLVDTTQALYLLFVSLLTQSWILKTLGFAILVGSIMALIEASGGIEGFIEYLQDKKALVKSERAALLLSYIVGVVIFIESSITSLISGAVGKPFCRRYKIPQAKLAFVCDSTAAPISSLIVLNGWGALLLGLITTQISEGVIKYDSLSLLVDALMYNFYAMSALLVTFLFIWFKIDIGPMKYAKYSSDSHNSADTHKSASSLFMLLPIFVMVILVFVFLYVTGEGDILKGSGSSSIFYTMLTTLAFMFLYYILSKNMSIKEWGKSSYLGAKKLFPIAMILLFAFSIGEVTSQLKTGLYLASLASESLSPYMLAGVIFLLSSLISFATGTSWGTFSIMIPVAVPMAVGMDADIALCIGAVISGGVFGDHCSPISDTTIISAMAAECEVIEHVKTQLPYALISGGIALVLFLLFGIF